MMSITAVSPSHLMVCWLTTSSFSLLATTTEAATLFQRGHHPISPAADWHPLREPRQRQPRITRRLRAGLPNASPAAAAVAVVVSAEDERSLQTSDAAVPTSTVPTGSSAPALLLLPTTNAPRVTVPASAPTGVSTAPVDPPLSSGGDGSVVVVTARFRASWSLYTNDVISAARCAVDSTIAIVECFQSNITLLETATLVTCNPASDTSLLRCVDAGATFLGDFASFVEYVRCA
jgi:hypothetical protein